MGVTGLWRLIEPSGKPVPIETLDNKILAVDVSIWLHQAIKGFQTSEGGALQNAHLLGIYHRICKLLYFGIRPILVFDGGVPDLKKETIYKRNQAKSKKLNEADDLQKQIITTLLKHTAVNSVALENNLKIAQIVPKTTTKENRDDIYKLPPTDFDITPPDDDIFNTGPTKHWDLHTIDEKSPHFKSLPADVRHDILTDLKETRKQSSWGRIHEMPKQSGDFSSFQMKRLLKRYSVQVSLEEAEKEMGGRSLSLAELETLLHDQGVVTSNDTLGNRIASNENTKYLLIRNLKMAMDEAKKRAELEAVEENDESANSHEEEFQDDLKKAIELSMRDVPSTSKETVKNKHSFLESFNDLDFQSSSESEDESRQRKKKVDDILSTVKGYMMEHSGLTPNEISKIIASNTNPSENEVVKTTTKDVEVEVIPNLYPDDTNRNQKRNVNDALESIKEVRDVDTNKQNEVVENTTKSSEDLKKVTPTPDASTKFEETQKGDVEIIMKPTDELQNDEEKWDVDIGNETQTEECNVEIISNASGSDSSDDFVDVSVESEEKQKLLMEIVVQPEEHLEDDLFSDIFSSSQKDADVQLDVPIGTKTNETSEAEPAAAKSAETKSARTKSAEAEESGTKAPEEKECLTKQHLQEMGQQLDEEMQNLLSERLSKERSVNGLTDQIYQETQELLHLFGVPYVMAPMEAEAQCAFMDFVNLTDGTITDDSDIWLFGGKTVYKNFFNQQKYVVEFKAENIEQHFKLSREQMVLLALLVGSDYTVGISGIGPVTALEVLAAFPSSKSKIENENDYQSILTGLEEFRKWLMNDKPVGYGKTALRNKLKNVTCIGSFPSLNVIKAYLSPSVDTSKEPFLWAKPNLKGLINFAMSKFGWSRVKSESILKPVLKRISDNYKQKTIKHYFPTTHQSVGDVDSKLSKRVKRAITKIEKGPNDDPEPKKNKPKIPRKRKKKEIDPDLDVPKSLSLDEDVEVLNKAEKESKRKVQQIESEMQNELDRLDNKQEQAKKPRTVESLHRKEVIPQKENDKVNALRSKLKAIEVYRKSKRGPGFVQKKKAAKRKPKEDAELSESSSD